MGVVFKARDPLIDRLVALKTIALAASQSDDLRQRFYREAQAAGGLQHPNIVTIYEMGEENGVPFIAMEYLEGESLDAVLGKKAHMPLAQRLGYVVQVCRALSYAHQHGIVHRDIKPANIVVTRDGRVKVVDFGIARIVDTSKTQTGVLLGTLAYMSPQLVKGERADERSDLWATGVLCYELFAGLKPFDGDNHAALLMSILSDEPPSLARIAPDCPEELRVIIEKMLRKKAEERYQSFEELLREIEPIWRRHQREWVDFLLAQSREFVRKGDLPEARKMLLQARVVDATRTLSREMLEKVNAALKDKLLPLEIAEHLERARSLRSEGSLEEARAAAKSALGLDSKSEAARQVLAEITHDLELLQQTKQSQRATALDRLLTAMRADIQRGSPSEAIRLGREALGRAGHDDRVSELVELAERKLREQDPPASRKEPGDVEIELYPKGDDSEKLIREYVFERVAPQTEGSHSSLPRVSAQAVESSPRTINSRLASKSASAPASQESTAKKHAAQRSGTLVLPQPAEGSRVRRPWRKTFVYATLTIVVVWAAASIGWRRRLPAPSPPAVSVAQTTAAAEVRPKEQIVAPPRAGNDASVEPVANLAPKKSEEGRLFAQAQQLAQSADSATLHQAQNLLDRVVATNGAHRGQAEELRDDVQRRLSKNEQELQRTQQFSALATQARRDLDTGDTASARAKLSEIHRLGGDDENLSAEIARTERARFASLESEYQQDAQSADERARNHLGELQRQFRALADSGGPLAANAKNYAENLIPAKVAEIGARIAAANNNAAESQAFESAAKDYKKFLESRDLNSLKTVVFPRFQAIVQGGGAHSAAAHQYVDNLIPAAIRQLGPYPPIGCAEVPSGLRPSVKAGELVACGLLDPPRLKWVQFTWPEFPARARQAGQVKGVAMLILTVDENGNVLEAKPRGRSDAYGFADAAVQMAHGWKTNPPRAQNKPVRTQFSVDVSFSQ
jgi:TonB family protein